MRKVLIWRKSAYRISTQSFRPLQPNLKISSRLLGLKVGALLQKSTFSLGQKGCAYYEKSAYYECAYYERAQYYQMIDLRSREIEYRMC